MTDQQMSGEFQSPGGFVFGVQGFMWGQPQPKSITFFLDNTAKVSDQHGRPIKGTVVDNKEILFAQGPPKNDDLPGARAKLATHAQVIEALTQERVDWRTLPYAGWPQLSYKELMDLPELPPTPLEELRKIQDKKLRTDALRARREVDEVTAREMAEVEAE